MSSCGIWLNMAQKNLTYPCILFLFTLHIVSQLFLYDFAKTLHLSSKTKDNTKHCWFGQEKSTLHQTIEEHSISPAQHIDFISKLEIRLLQWNCEIALGVIWCKIDISQRHNFSVWLLCTLCPHSLANTRTHTHTQAFAPLCVLSSCRLDGLVSNCVTRTSGFYGERLIWLSYVLVSSGFIHRLHHLVCTAWNKEKHLHRGPLGLNPLTRTVFFM